MRNLVGLASVATLAGFSWFGWQGMHEGMSATLAQTAAVELSKYKMDGVSIEFDHLDGLVTGALTEEQKKDVREILAGKLPMSRLIFTDEMAASSTDLSFPDTDTIADNDGDAIEVYSQALVDSEAAIEQGEVQGTDLSFVDPRQSEVADEEETFVRVAKLPNRETVSEQLEKIDEQPTPNTVANARSNDPSKSLPAERNESVETTLEETTLEDQDVQGKQTQPVNELADANTTPDADNSQASSQVSTTPESVESVDPTSENSEQIASTLDPVPETKGDADQTTVADASSPNIIQFNSVDLLPSVANDPVGQIAASTPILEIESQVASTEAPTQSARIAITPDIETAESPQSTSVEDATVAKSQDAQHTDTELADSKEEPKASPALPTKPTTDQTEPRQPEDSIRPKSDELDQSDDIDETSVADVAVTPPNELEAANQTPTQTDAVAAAKAKAAKAEEEAEEDSPTDELGSESPNELPNDSSAALPANATATPSEQPPEPSKPSAPIEETKVNGESDDSDAVLRDLNVKQLPTNGDPQQLQVETGQNNVLPSAAKTTDDKSDSKPPADNDKSKQKARLGVYMTGTPNDSIVRMLDPKSSADSAGIRVGDRIVQIGMTKVTEFKHVNDAIGKLKTNDIVRIWFQRSGTLFVVDTRMKGRDASVTTPTIPKPEDGS